MIQSAKKAKVSGTPPEPLSTVTPYIASSMVLPEMTLKALVLGILLAMVFAASTCYLGLKVGRTISASIPAAVLSMAILRWFRRSNILENNIVQTTASAGEVVAAGAIFTLPALIMMGHWSGFSYLETFCIITIGGIIGVFFSVPLRRCMVVDQALPYPEGIAAGEILKAGDSSSTHQVKDLVWGATFGSVMTLIQTGFKVVSEAFQWFTLKGGAVFGIGIGFSPILIAAGRIIGFRGSFGILIGAVIAWGIGIPLYAFINGIPENTEALAVATGIAKSHFRYVGVGAMIVGGLWGVLSLFKPIRAAITSSFQALFCKHEVEQAPSRTEHDIPMVYVVLGILAATIPLFLLFTHVFEGFHLPLTTGAFWWTVVFSVVFCLIIGFLCASIGSYLTGVVGSSMTPISGITISAITLFSFSLVVLLGGTLEFSINTNYALNAAVMAIMVAAVMCTAASVSGDNLQDLKAGHIVGSTPWKQQIALVLGVIGGSLVLAPVLDILYQAYGVGEILPHAGMDPTKSLAAPQATLMATVAQGVFAQKLEWSMIGLGMGIGMITILFDLSLKKKGSSYRAPVLSVALGIYLPMTYTLPLVLGGLVGLVCERRLAKQRKNLGADYARVSEDLTRRSTLLASGIIAGESLMGILLAVPFALYQTDEILALNIPGFAPWSQVLGFALMGSLLYAFYRISNAIPKKA